MNFEWDKNKASENARKHGISFDEATAVFGDPFALTFEGVVNSEEEDRFLTSGRFLVISHTDREESIRLISAREMTSTERSNYEKY